MISAGSIILYGHDSSLLETRRLVLARIPSEVQTAKSLAEVEALLASHSSSLIVLCHSLSSRDCREALALVHSHPPGMKCLVMSEGRPVCELSDRDEIFSAFYAPGELVATVQRLIRDSHGVAVDPGSLEVRRRQ